MTITGTVAQINALLNTNATSTVSYVDNTDTPSATSTLTLTVHDNGNTGTGGDLVSIDTSTINITAVNDAPVFAATGSTLTVGDQRGREWQRLLHGSGTCGLLHRSGQRHHWHQHGCGGDGRHQRNRHQPGRRQRWDSRYHHHH